MNDRSTTYDGPAEIGGLVRTGTPPTSTGHVGPPPATSSTEPGIGPGMAVLVLVVAVEVAGQGRAVALPREERMSRYDAWKTDPDFDEEPVKDVDESDDGWRERDERGLDAEEER